MTSGPGILAARDGSGDHFDVPLAAGEALRTLIGRITVTVEAVFLSWDPDWAKSASTNRPGSRSSTLNWTGLPPGATFEVVDSSDFTFSGAVAPLLVSSVGERNRVSTRVLEATSTTTRLFSS